MAVGYGLKVEIFVLWGLWWKADLEQWNTRAWSKSGEGRKVGSLDWEQRADHEGVTLHQKYSLTRFVQYVMCEMRW